LPQYKTLQTDRWTDRQTTHCTKGSTDSTVGQKRVVEVLSPRDASVGVEREREGKERGEREKCTCRSIRRRICMSRKRSHRVHYTAEDTVHQRTRHQAPSQLPVATTTTTTTMMMMTMMMDQLMPTQHQLTLGQLPVSSETSSH